MATLLFGDSIGKGLTHVNDRLKRVKETPLDHIGSDYNIEIKSFTSYGQTLTRLHEKNIIKDQVSKLNLKEKNYCVFAIGGNEADYDWSEVSKNPTFDHLSKTPLNEFEALLTHYVAYLKSLHIEVVLLTTVPMISSRFFEHVILKQGLKENVMTFLNHDIETISRHQESYSHIISKVAYTYKTTLIDLRTPLLQTKNYNDYISIDGIHPNQKGYHLIYEIIKSYIETQDNLVLWKKTENKGELPLYNGI